MTEPNLFGQPQEHPADTREPLRASFVIDDDVFGWEVSGVCLLSPDDVGRKTPVEVKVLEWIDEPPWGESELLGADRTLITLVPAYECEVQP